MEHTSKTGPFQIRATEADKARWKAAAFAAGNASTWAREILSGQSDDRTAGVRPPDDREFVEALEDLRMRYGVRDPAEIIRMAVMAAARRDRAGVNPWLPVALRGDAQPAEPTPSAPSHPGGKPRR